MVFNLLVYLFFFSFNSLLAFSPSGDSGVGYEKFKSHYIFVNSRKENNFCLLCIPKNASTTLKNIIDTTKTRKYFDYKHRFEKYEKLIVIRDPMYRAMSIYNEIMKLRIDGDYKKTMASKFYKERNDLKKSFSLFLDEIKNNFYDFHLTFQCHALTHMDLTLEDLDYIFLFEELDSDILDFCNKNSIPYVPTHMNKTNLKQKNILTSFIDENLYIQDKIRDIWELDFEFYERAKEARKNINSKYLAN